MARDFSTIEAERIGRELGIDFKHISLEQFRRGLSVELEHGWVHAETNVTNDDEHLTGKIAWAHLLEMPDYYTRLDTMERSAEQKPSL